MRQGIETKFLGPTNCKGARIVAKAYAGKFTMSYEYGLSVEQNHMKACEELALKLGWYGRWLGGGNVKGTGYNFVMTASYDHSSEPARSYQIGTPIYVGCEMANV